MQLFEVEINKITRTVINSQQRLHNHAVCQHRK